ncbi:MAG: hypothetical protein KAX16_04560, partial [Actinomycetia bacterium]|nr:hypothetical protein [Actinomycetes bacterium]
KGRSIVSYEEVERESNDPDQWTLSVDIVDAYKDGELNKKDLVFSLVHELGHILTLGPDQIDINTEELEPDCGRRFDSGDGCAKELSYLRLPKDRAKTFQNHGQTLS